MVQDPEQRVKYSILRPAAAQRPAAASEGGEIFERHHARGVSRSPRIALILLLVLTLVGGWLRFTATSFGLPDQFRPDEEFLVPRALNLGPDWNPHWAVYPPALMYMQSAALRVYAAALGKGSDFRSAYAADNGALAYLVARRVTAALGTATIPAIYVAAAPIYGPGAALSAAAIVAVSTIHVQDSKFARVDVAAAFWTTMAIAMLLRIVSRGRWSDYLAAGVFAGLAIATKYPSGAILFGIAAAHLEARHREGRAPVGSLRDCRIYLVAAGAVVATFCAAPYLVLDWKQTVRDFKGQWASSFLEQAPHGWRWLVFVAMPDSFGLALLALLIGGLLWALVRPKRGTLSLLVFLVVAFFAIATVHRTFYRYLLLPLPAMAILSGVLVSDLTLWPPWLFSRTPVGAVAGLILALILMPSLIRDVELDRLLLQTDTRTLARRWIVTHVPSFSAIAVTASLSPYGKPQLLSRYELVPMEDLGLTLRGKQVRWVLSDSLGPLQIFSPGLSPEQERELSTRATLVFEADPMRRGATSLPIFDAGDAFYAPLRNAASMERPGPRIRIWKLAAQAVGARVGPGATSITINSSTGVATGDVIFCYVGTHDSAANITVTTPPGWTLIAGPLNPTTGIESYLFQRISDGTDGASYTFNFSGSTSYFGYASQITYRGVNNATPVDGSVTTATPTSGTTSIVLPAVSPVGSSDLLVAFVADYGRFSSTVAATGMTNEMQLANQNAILEQQLTSSGSTGTRTVTEGSESWWTGFMFAVSPSRGGIQPIY
jgi:hypothetical protein